ncbi:SusE domain-containing protein [Chitinophaga japonensis]|uniref:SusE-like outer membrane protein n=1 Tax=Chitinophaga japonensis TaxID=104662 RepID=A0A562SZZ6_CHIJA|nr:SusE domain-containing protein [Chitinophaga japonensis]TWI86812.1 SusE-like outer membrane protein [Chitinophaga japonensis]
MTRKFNVYILFHLLLAIALLPACEKDDTINTNISGVKDLYYPETNKYIKLQPATNAVVSFEWSQARAEDGSLVMYEVVFDTAGGDFSHPIYSVASNGNGVENVLALSHKTLNTIAGKAGIQPSTAGTLQWTVVASKGLNELRADSSREIVVERPAGFTELPVSVYITGDATEGGADLAQAKPMKLNSDGTFEIFTRLKDGSYHFADRNTGTPVTYSLQGTRVQEGGENQHSGDQVYRIRLDFANAVAEVTAITEVGIYAAAYNAVIGTLDYAGDGVWTGQDIAIAYYDFGSWKDDRFKFRFATTDASGTADAVFYGSVNQDNPAPPDANTPEAYFKLVPVDNSQWNFTFKYPAGADGKKGNFTVTMNAGADYSYELTVQ